MVAGHSDETVHFGKYLALTERFFAPYRTAAGRRATLAETGANVKIVLMDNASLGLVQQQQELFYGERVYASLYTAPPDFTTIARGFGLQAIDLDAANDPRATLYGLLNAPGPCLIHAGIDRDARVYPMVPPGAANTQMIGGA